MPNIIELNLLENKSIVATMQGYPLANENSYKIIAGEENATTFTIKSLPIEYNTARLTVEMVNSKGYGVAETDINEIYVGVKGFTLPKGMAVAGYGYILIRAYIGEEVVVFQPLKLKVWNTLPNWVNEIVTLEINTYNVNVAEDSWQEDSEISPFKYKALVYNSQTIGDNSTLRLVNNNPILFATYGINIASYNLSTKEITFYAVEEPKKDIILTIEVY